MVQSPKSLNEATTLVSNLAPGNSSISSTKIFYGWWLVGLCVITMMVVLTPVFHGIGFFFVALERDFKWSRTILSVPLSLGRAEGALLGPLEGFLTDRLGSRRMVLIGLTMLGAGFVAFSFIDSIIGYYAVFLVIFAGAGLGGFLPFITILNNWFLKHRSKAMGIGMLGVSLGGLLAPVLGHVIETFGWRPAALWMGILVWVLAIPISSAIRNRPEDYGQNPDGAPDLNSGIDSSIGAPHAPVDDGSLTVSEAIRTGSFWAITAAHGLANLAPTALAVHLVPALADRGMSLGLSGIVVLAFGITGAVFQVIGGYIGDRSSKPITFAVFALIQGLGVLAVTLIPTTFGAFIFAFLYGVGFGGRLPVLTALRGEYFGRKNYATIYGISQVPINLLAMFGPIAMGYYFDISQSYTFAFLFITVASFLSAILILMARKPTRSLP